MKINHDFISKASLSKKLTSLWSKKSIIGHFINRFQWYNYPRIGIVRPYPIHVDIETSSKCQLKCPMCFRENREVEGQGNMNFDLFKKIIDEIESKVYSIKFTGRGEPLLNKKMPEFIHYLKGKNFSEVALITNGQLMNDKVINALIDAQVDRVAFSIDGLKDEYERIRKPITYDEIQQRVKALFDMKKQRQSKLPLIRIQGVKTSIEEDEKFCNIWDKWSDEILFLEYKDYAQESKHLPQEPSPCPLLWQRLMIHHDGKVPMCINDEYEESVMGSLENDQLLSIWKGNIFNTARSIHRKLERDKMYINCRGCTLYRKGHGN